MAGSHYNRCWIVYSPFYEALERLLFMRFIDDHHIQLPEDFKQTENVDFSIHNIIEKHNDLLAKYFQFKDEVRSGILGKTAQFWVMNFMDLMEIQFRAHLAVQENDYVLRHQAWKAYLPHYCSTNKVNYQRYGGFYVATLENIDNLYPGNKELLSRNGFSVQSQNKYLLRTAVDQRGEQTLNPDAKVAGGIKMIGNDECSRLKWTLNRSEESKNISELMKMADLDTANNVYKGLRPSQVKRSENVTSQIVNTLTKEYINPFGCDLDKDQLFNLSSGLPVCRELSEKILKVTARG